MFPLGLLSILQAAFLPGWIILRLLGLAGGGALRTLTLSFPLSLLFNYVLVAGLTTIGVNRPAVLWGVFAAECVIALVLLVRAEPSTQPSDFDRLRDLVQGLLDGPRPRMAAGLLAIGAATAALGLWARLAITASSSVFSHWDAIVSWNRWAVDWYNSRLPTITWNYPQLVPTTISTTYTFAATPQIQFFAMAVMTLFPLALLLALIDLALRSGLVRYLWAAALVGLLFPRFMGEFSMSGYADEPAAALTALTLYTLLLGSAAESWGQAKRFIIVGALCAAAAALAKQSGWPVAVLYPLLSVLIVRGQQRLAPRIGLAVATAAVIVTLVGPWYVYRYFVPAGSEVRYILVVIHENRTYAERAVRAAGFAASALGWPVWTLYVAAPLGLALSLLDRSWRWFTLLLIAPVTVIWLLFMGYSQRNAAVAFPLTIIAGAVGVSQLLELIPRPRPELRAAIVRFAAVATVVCAVVWPAFTVFRYSRLLKAQVRQQREIGHANINKALYNYAEAVGFDGKIVSNYQVLRWLPSFEELYTFHSLQESRGLDRLLDLPDHKFLLYIGGRPLPACVQELDARGRLTQVRTGPGYALFRKTDAAELSASSPAAGAP